MAVEPVSPSMSHDVGPNTNRGVDVPTRDPTLDADTALQVLADDEVRELFETTGKTRTIPELASKCDLSRSTAYRKVNRLVEAELLVPTARNAEDTGQATEYRRTVESVEITVESETTIEFP